MSFGRTTSHRGKMSSTLPCSQLVGLSTCVLLSSLDVTGRVLHPSFVSILRQRPGTTTTLQHGNAGSEAQVDVQYTRLEERNLGKIDVMQKMYLMSLNAANTNRTCYIYIVVVTQFIP